MDGREVAVLGQRVGCCYLRLKKKGSETFAIYISTALNDRANLRERVLPDRALHPRA